MTDAPESVRNLASKFASEGRHEDANVFRRYADLLERIEKAPVAYVHANGKVTKHWFMIGLHGKPSVGKRVALVEVE